MQGVGAINFICEGNSSPHPPRSIYSLLIIRWNHMFASRTQGTDAFDTCIWQFLFVAYASTLHIRLALQPSSDSDWFLTERNPLNAVCHG